MVRLPQPILTNRQLDILCNIRYKGFNTIKLPMVFEASKGAEGLKEALDNLCHMAEQSVNDGINYIILSDRGVDENMQPYHLCSRLVPCIITLYRYKNVWRRRLWLRAVKRVR